MTSETTKKLLIGTAGIITVARHFEEKYALRLTLMRLNNSSIHFHFCTYDADYIPLLVDECLQNEIIVEEYCPEVILNINI